MAMQDKERKKKKKEEKKKEEENTNKPTAVWLMQESQKHPSLEKIYI